MSIIKLFAPEGATGGGDPNPVFDQNYVSELRNEAKNYRLSAEETARKLKEVQDRIDADEKDKLTKNSEFEKLASQYKSEAETAQAEAARLKKIEEDYNNLQTQRRNELIEQLPDADSKAIAARIADISLLADYVKQTLKISGKKVHTDGNPPGYGTVDIKGRKFKDLTYDEQTALYTSNRAEYDRLLKEQFK